MGDSNRDIELQEWEPLMPSRTYTSGVINQNRHLDKDTKTEICNISQISFERQLSDENIEKFTLIPDQISLMHTQLADNTVLEPEELQEKLFKCDSWRVKWRIVAICAWFFSIGWNDATAGSILAYIENYYHISYALVSLIWLGNALGYITIAATSHWLNNKIGFYRMTIISPVFFCILAGIISSGTKFPLIVVAYYSAGLGASVGLSQFNVYLSQFDIASTLLGAGHGCYGLGATMAPIISTVMTDNDVPWYYFYLCLLGFMAINTVNLFFAFKGIDNEIIEMSETQTKEELHISASLKNFNTWLVCFFILFYQGAEVGLAGYIVSYLLDYRHGSINTVGYVASGFWGGLTLGRFLMTTVLLKKVGARKSIFGLTVLSIIFIILSWFVPNLILESVFISIAGIFIGPMYSMIISSASRIIPRRLVVVSLSLASAFGSTGGSLFPFLIGLISQFSGSFVVLPFSIGLFVAMLLCWFALPNIDRSNIKNWWERLV